MKPSRFALLSMVVWVCGCGTQAAVAPKPPPAPAVPAPATKAPQQEAAQPLILTAPPPADCPIPALPTPPPGDCPGDAKAKLTALDQALSQPSAEQRVARLGNLEACGAFDRGLMLALIADLGPPECADVAVDPWLRTPPADLGLEISQVLKGLSLAAKLKRTSSEPPYLPEPFDKQIFEGFMRDRLRPWFVAQARTIEQLALEGVKLSGYGKAISAIESGFADLRFVERVRQVPLPSELSEDPELEEAYRQSLEDALEPRKQRGRDAMLVGMAQLSRIGVLNEPRLFRARQQLARLFSGSRIDALDGLLLPPLEPAPEVTDVERLAARLPTFYAERILVELTPLNREVLRALLERGIPQRLVPSIEELVRARPEIGSLYSRGLLDLGRLYFRPSDFAHAAAVAAASAEAQKKASDQAKLTSALASALRGGPENAIALMLKGPMLPEGMGNVDELDRLAKHNDLLGGYAAYDAAYLLSILPQKSASVDHWKGIEKRFLAAAKRMVHPKQKELCRSRAEDARAIANQIAAQEASPAPPPEAAPSQATP